MPTLQLPCGVQVGPGRVEKLIEVRKLTAKAQRDLNSQDSAKNPALFTDALVATNVLKVGQTPALTSLKNEMLMPDREWLSMQLRKLTFGPIIKGTYFCNACHAAGKPQKECEMTHSFNIDDMPVRGLDEAEQSWWDGEKPFKLDVSPSDPAFEELRKKAKTRCFVLADDKLGYEAIFRYPNGMDERKFAPLMVADPPQKALAAQEMIARCLLKFNDTPRPRGADGFGLDFFDELDLDVAMGLEKAFFAAIPGQEKKQEIECAHGHSNEVELKSTDFLGS